MTLTIVGEVALAFTLGTARDILVCHKPFPNGLDKNYHVVNQRLASHQEPAKMHHRQVGHDHDAFMVSEVVLC